MKIIGKFYLSSGQELQDGNIYEKANEKVTDEEFEKEIEKIVENFKTFLLDEIICQSSKVFSFGRLMIKISDISAFYFSIEKDTLEGGEDLYNEFNYENEEEPIAIIR